MTHIWALVADVGGTSTRVALFQGSACLHKAVYVSQIYEDISSILLEFWSQLPQAKIIERKELRVCLALPGPVHQGKCEITNLPWAIDSRALSQLLGFPSIELINDLQAHAYAIDLLKEQDLAVIQGGVKEFRGNRVLIIAGTGLGEASLLWDGERHRPFASEGGHCDFAPIDESDVDLWRHLKERYGHVSYERVLSGSGLCMLYEFLMREQKKEELTTYEIVHRALQEGCPVARQTLEKFASLYGSEAGNMALKSLCFGGVYIGGGLANAILPSFQEAFLSAFIAKGRMRPLLEKVPLLLILNQETGLLGAANYLNVS